MLFSAYPRDRRRDSSAWVIVKHDGKSIRVKAPKKFGLPKTYPGSKGRELGRAVYEALARRVKFPYVVEKEWPRRIAPYPVRPVPSETTVYRQLGFTVDGAEFPEWGFAVARGPDTEGPGGALYDTWEILHLPTGLFVAWVFGVPASNAVNAGMQFAADLERHGAPTWDAWREGSREDLLTILDTGAVRDSLYQAVGRAWLLHYPGRKARKISHLPGGAGLPR